MKKPVFRFLLAALAAVLALGASGLAGAAESYPNRTIRMIVPFPAAGATDLMSRAMAQKLGEVLGVAVVVDNRPDAGGAIGSDAAAKSAPDGYTILMATSSTHSISIGPSLNPKLPYKVESDFTPISEVATSPNLLLVTKKLPVSTPRELVLYARSHPGQLNYASSGNGTIIQLTAEAFKSQTNSFITHIPYKGAALAVPDMMDGKVHLMFDNIVSGMPHVRDGSLRALAVTGAKRSSLVPDLPTLDEVGRKEKDTGLAGFESSTWFGLYGPKGLPADIVAKLNAAVNKALQSPEVQDRFARMGAEPAGGTPAQFEATVKADTARWAKLIRERKIQAD
ncbi:MAG: tripartite tricarboxylate transporter substrate binding protein [Candidatus Protistobacter heckmanni]|nr:tripartite tricarboxylate transporter substrate binding protein [Candidatus Protistobacter heckmanni]